VDLLFGLVVPLFTSVGVTSAFSAVFTPRCGGYGVVPCSGYGIPTTLAQRASPPAVPHLAAWILLFTVNPRRRSLLDSGFFYFLKPRPENVLVCPTSRFTSTNVFPTRVPGSEAGCSCRTVFFFRTGMACLFKFSKTGFFSFSVGPFGFIVGITTRTGRIPAVFIVPVSTRSWTLRRTSWAPLAGLRFIFSEAKQGS